MGRLLGKRYHISFPKSILTFQLDPFSRLVRWVHLSNKSVGYRNYRFHRSTEHLAMKIEHLRQMSSEDLDGTKAMIFDHLQEKDSDIAFVCLQFLINNASLKPLDSQVDFSSWGRPMLEIELDIAGRLTQIGPCFGNIDGVESSFKESFSRMVLVEGGEFKFSWRGTAFPLPS